MTPVRHATPSPHANASPMRSEEETSEEQTSRALKRPANLRSSIAPEGLTPPPPAKGRKIHCLCADDNELLRCIMEKMLTSLGFEPDIVKNGKEAFDLLQEKSDHYLFTVFDMEMGSEEEMNGHIAIKRWRKREEELKLRTLPMFILSSNSDAESVALCFQCGATDVMSKPASRKILEEIIKKHTSPAMAEKHLSSSELERCD